MAAAFAVISLLLLVRVQGAAPVLGFTRSDFPEDFVFGSATSAYQYEGAVAEDGRSPSIWDTFTHAGNMPDRSNGDIAADGYHKYKDDVKLIIESNLEAYRFSISWSRLIPNGRGAVNPKGLEYYNNLIDELARHGVQVHVMIYQLDLPQILEDEYGGWLSPKIVEDFTAYADVCFREFGDRVSHWTTLDEANVAALGSYDIGQIAPGRCSDPFGFGTKKCTAGNSSVEPYIAAHNMLLAHASATRLYREKYQVGNLVPENITCVLTLVLYCFFFSQTRRRPEHHCIGRRNAHSVQTHLRPTHTLVKSGSYIVTSEIDPYNRSYI